MHPLVRILHFQHRALEQRLGRISDALEARDAAAIQGALPTLEIALGAHLKLEDAELYPTLLRVGRERNDEELEQVGSAFAAGIPALSASLVERIHRHSICRLDLAAFEQDWEEVSVALTTRIREEEATLYPLLERALRGRPSTPEALSPGA